MNYHRLLHLVISLGATLLENGAETYRVEESILRIFQGHDMAQVDVFVIPSMLIVTVRPNGSEKIYTQQKRIKVRGTDLTKIKEANDLCRYYCTHDMTLDDLEQRIETIRHGALYSQLTQYLGHVLAGSGFSLFFGGTLVDAFCAIFSSLMVKFIFDQMGKLETNTFFTNILASATLTAWAELMSISPLQANMDTTIIGPMMLLVPGMALTTSMRDIIAGDYISSLVKLVEVVMIGLGVALGAYISMTAMSFIV